MSTHSTSLWIGRTLSGLVIAFAALDGAMKLVPLQPVLEAQSALGFSGSTGLARGLGVLLLACTILHALPRTAVLGAILLTGFLGGTIAIHLRIGNPLFTHTLFGFYVGAMLWAGLLLRRPELRAWFFSCAPMRQGERA